METERYAIGDLAELAGVSRRTVRYYVQEGLLPAPFGVGRGRHYGPEHLDHIARVKRLQEAGRTLEEIRRVLARGAPGPEQVGASEAEPSLERTLWRRVVLSPGVELHLSADVRLPSARKLNELSQWCRQHCSAAARKDEDADV